MTRGYTFYSITLLIISVVLLTTFCNHPPSRARILSVDVQNVKSNGMNLHYLIDNNISTAWTSGRDRPALGQGFVIHFDRKVLVRGFSIRNGTGDVTDYEKTGRVKMLLVNGQKVLIPDSGYGTCIWIELQPFMTDRLQFTIAGIYPGLRTQETAIAEIFFTRRNQNLKNVTALVK